MKNSILILFFLINTVSFFSQQKSFKKFEITTNNLEINTEGLDEIIIENSNDNFISILLDEANPFAHQIGTYNENGILKISFQPEIAQKEHIFRKYITERLHRASVRIKIPKYKSLTLLGDEVDITSKSYYGNITAYIDKGTLNFNKIRGDLQLILSSGNVFGIITSEMIKSLISLRGKINIDNKIVQSPYNYTSKNSERKLVVKSITANIRLTTQKQ